MSLKTFAALIPGGAQGESAERRENANQRRGATRMPRGQLSRRGH